MFARLLKLARWWADEGGIEPAEWALVLGVAIIPIAYFMMQIAWYLARFYEITSWVTTLPFP